MIAANIEGFIIDPSKESRQINRLKKFTQNIKRNTGLFETNPCVTRQPSAMQFGFDKKSSYHLWNNDTLISKMKNEIVYTCTCSVGCNPIIKLWFISHGIILHLNHSRSIVEMTTYLYQTLL